MNATTRVPRRPGRPYKIPHHELDTALASLTAAEKAAISAVFEGLPNDLRGDAKQKRQNSAAYARHLLSEQREKPAARVDDPLERLTPHRRERILRMAESIQRDPGLEKLADDRVAAVLHRQGFNDVAERTLRHDMPTVRAYIAGQRGLAED